MGGFIDEVEFIANDRAGNKPYWVYVTTNDGIGVCGAIEYFGPTGARLAVEIRVRKGRSVHGVILAAHAIASVQILLSENEKPLIPDA